MLFIFQHQVRQAWNFAPDVIEAEPWEHTNVQKWPRISGNQPGHHLPCQISALPLTQNDLGWEGPLRSPIPAVNPALPNPALLHVLNTPACTSVFAVPWFSAGGQRREFFALFHLFYKDLVGLNLWFSFAAAEKGESFGHQSVTAPAGSQKVWMQFPALLQNSCVTQLMQFL